MGELRRFFRSFFTYRNPTLGVLVPLIIYIYLRFFNSALDLELSFPAHHFHIVSATSFIAFCVAVVVGLVGVRQRNLQVIYVSLAFISLAAIFTVHGLATPGFILDQNAVVGVAAQLSVLTMSFWLLISSLPSDQGISAWLGTRARALLILWIPLIVIAGIVALNQPTIVLLIPVNQAPLRYVAGGLTLAMTVVAGYRYWKSYRYSKFPFQLALVYACGWIAVTQFIISTGHTFFLSWWIYHLLLLLSVIVCVIGLVVQYRRGDSTVRSIQGLFSTDPEERLEAAISPAVRDLITTTEKRDPYTAGHQYRVALGAFRLGQALNLKPEDLRVLAQGGVVHDIGKLEVPNEVLNKPGPLNAEERKAIEFHTIAGYEMCARLGFMAQELSVIRWHHERIDGMGYPDRLSGEDIPLLARVMAVSDVYDALTSARAYRPAWPEEEAVGYMLQNRGTQFEPRLVNLWVELVRNDSGKAAASGPAPKKK